MPTATDAALRLLTPITADLWHIVHPFRLLGLFPLGHRMTVIRRPADGGLILHSPVPYSDELRAELHTLGTVREIVAPSLLHDLDLGPWVEAYPDATFRAVDGFGDKKGLPSPDAVLDDDHAPEGLEPVTLQGMPKVRECVLLHRPSRSLIVADCAFHFPRSDSFALRMLLRLVGAYGKLGPSRLFRAMIADRQAFRASLERVLALDFDRLIVGHGEIVETGARQQLRAAYGELLGG